MFPQKYQTTKPVLFVYWTADGYNKTGSYNTDDIGFVLQGNSWPLGMALDTISTDSGQQCELEITCQLISGNWWLYINGTTKDDAIGYYPTTLYSGGQMSSNATEITYGGEVVNQTFWPPMGSGSFAAAGYQHAAYQRDISYFDMALTVEQANLTAVQDSANCYTTISSTEADPWNANFFFGGPGGDDCN